jgi:hypothetical protein
MKLFNPRDIVDFEGLIKNSYPYWQYYVNGVNKTESNHNIYSNKNSITISTKENNYVKKAHSFQLILSIFNFILFFRVITKN